MMDVGRLVRMVDVSFVPRKALATVVDLVDAMLNQSDSGFLLLYPRTRNQGRKQITVNLIEQLISYFKFLLIHLCKTTFTTRRWSVTENNPNATCFRSTTYPLQQQHQGENVAKNSKALVTAISSASWSNCASYFASLLRRKLHPLACPERQFPFPASKGREPACRRQLPTQASTLELAWHLSELILAAQSLSRRALASQI